ncbi:MAG: hypothetical protein U1E65_06780 [Myxococcota bacterium]
MGGPKAPWVFLVASALGAGCVTGHPLSMPYLEETKPVLDRSLIELRLEYFGVQSEQRPEASASAEIPRTQLVRALRQEARWAEVIDAPAVLALGPASDHVPIGIRVNASLEQTFDPTFVLELLAPFTYAFFSPVYGDVSLRLEVRIKLPTDEEALPPIAFSVTAPYSQFDYGWFDTREVDAAYRRIWSVGLARIVREIMAQVDAHPTRAKLAPLLLAAAKARAERESLVRVGHLLGREGAYRPSALGAVDPQPLPIDTSTRSVIRPVATTTHSDPLLEAAAAEIRAAEPKDLVLPNLGFDIIRRPENRVDDSFLHRYLGALGGLELAAFRGGANVESRTRTVNAPDEVVGSGGARSTGYRIEAYRPPDRTGWFFPPTIGLLWQDISIASFREDSRVVQRAGRQDIPAIASDPATGAPLDINEPISYALKMRSAYLGQGIGINLVFGTPDVQLFFSGVLSINLAELRYLDIQIWKSHVDGFKAEVFHSGSLSGQMGLAIQPWHIALRLAGSYARYLEFSFPKEVEFPAASRYNPDKDVYERQRAFVTSASLEAYDVSFSAVYLF